MIMNEINTFIIVADCGSFGKAAEKLYISPTAVMKQMNFLENYLGIKLMTRSNHGIHLTDCGEILYKDSKFMISYSEKAIKNLRQIASREKHIFRVGTSMLNPCKIFMDLWYKVNERFPNYKIHVIPFEDNHEGILSVIEQIGIKYDFIIGVCDSKKWLSKCNMLILGKYKKCVAVPSYHKLANKKVLKISDLYDETLIMVKKGDSQVNDDLRNNIEKNHPQINIEDTEHFYDINVFNRCEQSGNILLNLECWNDIHPNLVTIPVDWQYGITYGLLYPLNPSKEIITFINEIKSVIK